jgi:dTDP-4-amino-4,6-dideoxygalactose transaminase
VPTDLVMKTSPAHAGANALALDGGKPVRSAPLPPWPYFADDEIEAVRAVLASGQVNYWTGEQCALFEKEFAAYVGTRHAVALANGSLALELALHVLGIGPGDDVVVTCRSFVASASCVVLRGARPVFADVDPASQNITAETVRAALTPKTRAVIAVHLTGWPCDLDPLLELARSHGIAVIEDCAQSHGATYKSRVTGSFGAVAAFSFCQDKIMTTGGEGGMLLTNDEELWKKAWSYKDHGKSHDATFTREHPPGYRWLHESFGSNWRMTEMQAAIGRRQLAKLPQWVASRRRNASLMDAALAAAPGLRVHVPPEEFGHAYYKYYLFVEPSRLRRDWTRQRILDAISAEGIPCAAGICPEIYLEKAFAERGLGPASRLPNAKKLGETSIMLMLHPTMTEDDIRDMRDAVIKVMSVAARA